MIRDLWSEALRTLAAAGIRGPELAELCVVLSGLPITPGLAVWRDVETRLQLGSAKLDPRLRPRREFLVRTVADGPAIGLALWILVRAIDGGDLEARSAVFSEA